MVTRLHRGFFFLLIFIQNQNEFILLLVKEYNSLCSVDIHGQCVFVYMI